MASISRWPSLVSTSDDSTALWRFEREAQAASALNHPKPLPLRASTVRRIWILPDQNGLKPAYAQNPIDRTEAERSFALLVSQDGRESSITIHQDVDLWLALMAANQQRR
jgi:hypothetical protein